MKRYYDRESLKRYDYEVNSILAMQISTLINVLTLQLTFINSLVQGDPSGLSKPIVDIDLKVAF